MSHRVDADVALRVLEPGDREPARSILVRTGFFTAVEVATALELIDEWLATADASGYLCFVATDRSTGTLLGYVCVGPAPMTEGTFDLYWIAVDPEVQGRGVGRALLQRAEDEVAHRAGRLLLIETSSQIAYQSTVRFYERCGYALLARIADYYRPGDDKLVFGRKTGCETEET